MSVMIFPALLKEEEVDVITHQRTQDCLLIHENGLLANFITLLCLLLFFVFPFFLSCLSTPPFTVSHQLFPLLEYDFLVKGIHFHSFSPKDCLHNFSWLMPSLLLFLLSPPVLFHFTSRKRYYECVVSSLGRWFRAWIHSWNFSFMQREKKGTVTFFHPYCLRCLYKYCGAVRDEKRSSFRKHSKGHLKVKAKRLTDFTDTNITQIFTAHLMLLLLPLFFDHKPQTEMFSFFKIHDMQSYKMSM